MWKKNKSKRKIKVLIYPKCSNPYQDLLYSHFPKNTDITLTYIANPEGVLSYIFQIFIITYKLLYYKAHGYNILHLHWTHPLEFPRPILFSDLSDIIYFMQVIWFLTSLRILNYKLVYTIHDVMPHIRRPKYELITTQKFLNQADKLIILSRYTVQEIEMLNLKYDQQKIIVIPHGNYIATYLNIVSREDARKYLKIPQEAWVFLFFGHIEPYKNVPVLLESFNRLSEKYKNVYLIIAGKTYNTAIMDIIKDFKLKLKYKLILHIKFIPDDEVQFFYNSADLAVHPFLAISNSGSTILSSSFGTPIIAPRLGSLIDLPQNIGFFYDPQDKEGLYKAMEESMRKDKNSPNMKININSYINNTNWNEIAEKTETVYKGITV